LRHNYLKTNSKYVVNWCALASWLSCIIPVMQQYELVQMTSVKLRNFEER